jgi:hypothetical protein
MSLLLGGVGCMSAPAPTITPVITPHAIAESLTRDPAIPDLPFPDNPDPTQCGIPTLYGRGETPAWLNGVYDGVMIQPIVYLYDSHLRQQIATQAPHGTEVQVLMYQSNPVLNYYLVKIVGADPPNEGWIPAPLLSFEPITP